jgi:type IX secretion system PorP/SprF family membrane protein
MKKLFIILISSVFVIYSVQAQYDAQFSQNMNCLSVSNPAMLSMDGYSKLLGVTRQQWVGLENAPSTSLFNMTFPFQIDGVRQAAGVLFSSDNAGLFSNKIVYLQYAYQRAFSQGTISFGGNLGFLNATFDGTKVFIPESDYHTPAGSDELIPSSSETGMGLDLCLGAAYYDDKRYVGISVFHITSPTITIGDNTVINIKPLINITGGYNFSMSNSLYVLKPSIFVKTDLSSYQVDLNTNVEYNKMFWGGISYRLEDAVVLLIGLKLANGMDIGYSYDITTSKLFSYSGGSHEVVIIYNFKLDFLKSSKYKSIRIL